MPIELEAALDRLYPDARPARRPLPAAARRRRAAGRRCRTAEGPRQRGAGHPPGQPDHRPRRRDARLRHPHRAVRGPAARALPLRRRAARGGAPRRAGCAPRSSRASRSWRSSTSPSAGCRRTAASGSRCAARRSISASPPCPSLHGESVVLRILDRGAVAFDLRHARLRRAGDRAAAGGAATCPTASCWSPARPAAARPRRSTPRLLPLNAATARSSRSRTRSNTSLRGINQIQVQPQIG